MSVTQVPQTLRDAVRLRARGCCEYCRLHEDDAYESHEADHIIAEQHGGETAPENLAYACWECNRRKGPNLASRDPETGDVVRLFDPRHHRWSEHFRLDGWRIVPLTPVGRATASLLRFDSPERLRVLALLHRLGRYPVR
ncbi:MAG: HNH endonuclease [Chloroflexi bacterium]|nr:HNH endonuclease [Chloroflexota bacterium]